jgi:hypothetical protein
MPTEKGLQVEIARLRAENESLRRPARAHRGRVTYPPRGPVAGAHSPLRASGTGQSDQAPRSGTNQPLDLMIEALSLEVAATNPVTDGTFTLLIQECEGTSHLSQAAPESKCHRRRFPSSSRARNFANWLRESEQDRICLAGPRARAPTARRVGQRNRGVLIWNEPVRHPESLLRSSP